MEKTGQLTAQYIKHKAHTVFRSMSTFNCVALPCQKPKPENAKWKNYHLQIVKKVFFNIRHTYCLISGVEETVPCNCSASSPTAGNLPTEAEDDEENDESVLMVVADEALLLQKRY